MFFMRVRSSGNIPGARWAVRFTGDPLDLATIVRNEVAKLPGPPLMVEIEPMTAFVDRASAASTRFALVLIGVFAAIAVALAIVGLYSVLSTIVRQRTAEIGVGWPSAPAAAPCSDSSSDRAWR